MLLIFRSTKVVSRYNCMDSKVIATSIIFLFVTWYTDAAAWKVDVPWTIDITASKISLLLTVVIIQN